jgi:hypothetical protein
MLENMLATCTFNVITPCCLEEWRLIVAELDAGAEVDNGA